MEAPTLMSRRVALVAWIAAVLLAASSCRGVQPLLAPGGPEARSLADLGWLVLLVFSAVTIVMWVLLIWVATRPQGTLAQHAPWDAPSDKRWIYIGGFTVPAIILATIFVFTLRTMAAFPMGDNEMHMGAPSITVTGHQWWWEVEYQIGANHERVVTANEIHIPAGQPVDIELQTRDVIHSFWVPRLHGKVDLIPGMVNRIRVQADQPGIFRGECAEYCGPQHAHMILIIEAQAPAEFAAWLARLREPAAPPATSAAARGQQVFMTSACVTCHSIRGTDAHGLVGPDLTHVGSRKGIAANSYPNTTAYLEAWVTHAQSLKPNAQMPDITAFSGDDLRALVDYLQGLQ
jgi:cytochrome c oxidase subunit 2